MATTVSELVTLLRHRLRNQIDSTRLSDATLAALIGEATWQAQLDVNDTTFKISGKTANEAVLTTDKFNVTLPNKYVQLILTEAEWLIATGGARVMSELNVGRYTGPSGTTDTTSRPVSFRMDAEMINAERQRLIGLIKGFDQFVEDETNLFILEE